MCTLDVAQTPRTGHADEQRQPALAGTGPSDRTGTPALGFNDEDSDLTPAPSDDEADPHAAKGSRQDEPPEATLSRSPSVIDEGVMKRKKKKGGPRKKAKAGVARPLKTIKATKRL